MNLEFVEKEWLNGRTHALYFSAATLAPFACCLHSSYAVDVNAPNSANQPKTLMSQIFPDHVVLMHQGSLPLIDHLPAGQQVWSESQLKCPATKRTLM